MIEMTIKTKKIKRIKEICSLMIHIDPQVGLMCVNDPGHPGKFQFCHMPCPCASLGPFILIHFTSLHHFQDLSHENIYKFVIGEHRLIVLLLLKSGCLLITK